MRPLESPTRTGRGAEPRTVKRLGALSVQLVDSVEQVRNRDAYFRRLLATADVLAAGLALIVATSVGGDGDQLQLAAVLALPVFVVMAKLLGLYERDELVINKSTLDEAPAVFQLATLFVLLVWLAEAFVINGALGKPQFVVLGLTTFVGVLGGRAFMRWLGTRTAATERCLLLGPSYAAARIEAKLELGRHSGAEIVPRRDLEDDHGHVVVSGRLGELVARTGAERLILVPTGTESDAVLDLIREAKSLNVKTTLWPRFTCPISVSSTWQSTHISLTSPIWTMFVPWTSETIL